MHEYVCLSAVPFFGEYSVYMCVFYTVKCVIFNTRNKKYQNTFSGRPGYARTALLGSL